MAQLLPTTKPLPCKHGDHLGGQRNDWHHPLKRVHCRNPPSHQGLSPCPMQNIGVCSRVLRRGFKVHIPWQGVPGSLLYIKLTTFARFTHTVYGFLLGKQGGIWLCRDDKSRQYCFGYCTWVFFGESSRQGKYLRHC
jgi:hypothetical protein